MAETPFQVTGVASGIGWDEIISKTLEIARKPETIWQNKIDTLEYKKSLYEELTSQFRKLQNTLLQLNIESTYKAKTAEFIVRPKTNGGATAPDIAKATVNANADIASWDIDIDQLATAQRYISARQISTGAALGISGAFRIHVDTQVASITVEATDTLADINKKIQMSTDQKGQPLMATAKIFDNRLVIESSLTGLDKTGTLGAVNLTMSNKLYVEIQDPRDPTDPTKTIKNYITYVPKDVNNVLNPYPSQLLSVSSDGRNYVEGVDYSYDPSNGAITWNTLDSSNNEFVTHPADGETIGVYTVYAEAFTRGGGTEDTVQPLPSGTWLGIDSPPQTPPPPLPSSSCLFTVIDENGKKYTGAYAPDQATATTNTSPSPDPDNDFAVYFDTISGDYKILWNVDPAKSPAAGVDYEMSIRPGSGDYEYARNKVYLEEDNAASNANSVLAQLGFMIEDPMFTGSYIFDPANVNNAVDAIVKINGVTITVPDNEISADSDSGELIPNVKLELLGIGHVVMNITQDASGAVEAMEKFVEEYNNVMTLINDRLSEKYTQSSASADDDYLQSLLSESKSSTVFGVLHGDQLLWSIKNQLRNMITNSISTLSSSIRSRKVQHPNAPIDMKGSFYINSGGNVARIDVVPTDTLEDIERKLKFSTSINGYGTAQAKVDMGLDVSISNGQLVIKRPSSVALTDTRNDTLTRSGGDFAYLDYVPELSPPIGGKLTIISGETTFVENEDYRLNAFENENGVMESRIEWISGGRSPMVGDTYNVEYTYNPSAVSYSLVPSNAITSDPLESYLYNLSFLDLHQDMGKVQLSTYGITTESLDYGKSGLLEFDSQVFFEAIVEDSKQVSNVMVSFMKGLDSYIDNLASSSQVTVGGAVITKGRINAAMNNIDTEVLALQEQIDKLESQLAQRQETMYKQFTNMELAIQKLNAQMSSVSQYLSMNTNSSSSS